LAVGSGREGLKAVSERLAQVVGAGTGKIAAHSAVKAGERSHFGGAEGFESGFIDLLKEDI